MKQIFQHVTDDSSIRGSADGIEVIASGSLIGRVLFTDWAPLAYLTAPASITNCILRGGSALLVATTPGIAA